MDEADPCSQRIAGMQEPQRTSGQHHRTRIRWEISREYPDESRFPRAILTDQRVDFALAHIEIHSLQCTGLTEGLRDVGELEKGHVDACSASE